MPILDFHHLSHSDAVLYVLAVTFQPRDLGEQAGLFARLQIQNTSIAVNRGLQPAEWRVNQAVRQMTPLEPRDSDRTIGANAAAIMFQWALDGKSLNSACKEIHERHDIGISTCWGYWVEFRPAAHLNAARRLTPELWHSEPPDLRSLLRIAEDLRRRGEAHKMPRSGWLLDADETWKVPEAVFLLL